MERIGIKRILYNIWPTIYRLVNGTFYFILQLTRSTIRRMIDQIKS
ncbi:MAG: hypothetical protein HYW63_00365 [Candidatus Levybacteria bacterium]|nr:hypothetical protein [Candidatus Levybacteria bacterium]